MFNKNKEKKNEIDMCNGSILPKMLSFALPLMCSSMLQLLFNAADTIVVGRFAGDASLAAVGATTALINLLVNLFVGLSVGANVLAARDYGAKKEDELQKTIHTSMLISVLSGIVLTIIGVLFTKNILIIMNTPDDVLNLAAVYLRVYFLGMTATMIYNFGSAILRAVGDTKRPLYYLLISGIINVILNLVFVIIFRMDVAGVGLATAISQCISAFLIVKCLINEKGMMKLYIRKLHIYKDKLIEILKVGLPAGFQGVLFALSNVIIQSSINGFGKTVVAGNSAAASIEGFVYVAMNAFYQAAISFTGQNIGAGRTDRIKKILICSEGCVIVVGIVLGNLAYIAGRPLLSIYSSNSKVIDAGLVRMSIISVTYALCGMMDVMVGMLRGMGYSIMPMIISLIGVCGLRILWLATIFKIEKYHVVETVFLSYPITWIITIAAYVICYALVYKKVVKKYSRL